MPSPRRMTTMVSWYTPHTAAQRISCTRMKKSAMTTRMSGFSTSPTYTYWPVPNLCMLMNAREK